MRIIWIIIFLSLTSCRPSSNEEDIQMKPPIAEKIPFSFEVHGKSINDEYSWLRDPKWPNVTEVKIIDYLNAENQFTEHYFKNFSIQKEQIFRELKARIKLSDQSPYIKKDNFFYYTRTAEDKEYPIYCRKEGNIDAPEVIILDINALAENKKFTKIGALSVSPDHKLLAFSVDHNGDENYTIKIIDLEDNKYLIDEIPKTIGSIVWHEQISGFFYTPTNENWRHDKVMFHVLEQKYNEDRLIFHETDPLYNLSVQKSSSKQHIFLNNGGHDSNSVYVISMDDHEFTPKIIREKRDSIFYDVDHNGEHFYVKTNEKAKNFRIFRINDQDFARESSEIEIPADYIAEDSEKYLSSFDLAKNYLLLNYRVSGLPFIKVRNVFSGEEKLIDFPDQAFSAGGECVNFDEDDLRISYSSLGRPATTYSYDFSNNHLTTLKTQEIPSGFNPDEYMVERIFADNEGIRVPVSIFYKKSLFKKDGSNPVYLYGYGSYGIGMSASFRSTAVSLANRGFVFALAHIRGGDDLGHDWYEAAKFLNKKRTFEDFIAVADNLVQNKYTASGNIVISGGSAGGMLIGYVINHRPELFKAAIAHVPFVDVLNTMLDDTLPLTPGEYKEWGNPKEEQYFDYISSYSPYDNIVKQTYPNLFVTAGLSDPRVGYWEAAKWVAKLRANKADQNILLLKTNMDAGHGGASGRFDYLKEVADDLVFIFDMFKV